MAICPSGHKKYYGRSQYLLYEVYVSLVYPNRVLSYHEFTATSIPKKDISAPFRQKNNTGTVSLLTDAGCCLRHMHPLTVSMLFTICLIASIDHTAGITACRHIPGIHCLHRSSQFWGMHSCGTDTPLQTYTTSLRSNCVSVDCLNNVTNPRPNC